MYYAISTFAGLIFGILVTYIIMKIKFQKDYQNHFEELSHAKTELSTLQTQIKAQEDFRNLIKEDFSKLAVQTINEQQED